MNRLKFNSWLENPINPLIMGVLNITPDSFSDGGKYSSVNSIVDYAINMIEEGADIIDIGGESTRPGAKPISTDEELIRIVPAIKAIRKETDITISIDTYKSNTAERSLDIGADMINDITGLTRDPLMAGLVARKKSPIVLMHIKGTPYNMQKKIIYNDLITEITSYFNTQVSFALDSGVLRKNIILDPGIGFGKSVENNFEIISKLNEFSKLGFPVLIGPSRKSFIGSTLNLPVNQRLEGTLTAVISGIINGANIVRVHDIKSVKRSLLILEKIRKVE